jgi:hypothetical protein
VRNATVTATTALDVYCLDRSDFALLRHGAGDFEDAMENLVAARDTKRLQLLFRA